MTLQLPVVRKMRGMGMGLTHLGGRHVEASVAFELFLQTELNFSVDHDPWVKGPQAGNLLVDGTNVVLH